ncbi:ABC transporter substrate-binding protein [Halobellus ordinarius]|uniref:ABC transporter substrate-binding protein n=1 Tax=Halobellus ordinarius TaxID=3075120 RepID=UPI0028805C40|nr:substrate-binding domain-containing protein [Halobellus sp. ZY16]
MVRDNHSRAGNGFFNRRRFLKKSTALATGSAMMLAGCGGGDPDENGNGAQTEEQTTAQTTGQTTAQTGGVDLSGTKITYWNVFGAQSRAATRWAQNIVNRVSARTGAQIEVNYTLPAAFVLEKWRNAFDQGNHPVVYDSSTALDVFFFNRDDLTPLSELPAGPGRDTPLDPTIREGIQPLVDIAKSSIFDKYGGDIWEIPVQFHVFSPFLGRRDHFEQAGLDFESDFPPDDYEHLIDVATTLQEDGPGDFGYNIFGDAGDVMDTILPLWPLNRAGPEEGHVLGPDWETVNFDNEVWKQATRDYVDIYREHGLSNDNTPNEADETSVPAISNGTWSMTQPSYTIHPNLRQTAPDMLEDGTIQWAPSWSFDGNPSGLLSITGSFGITSPPDGADEEEWRKKQMVAVELVNEFLKESNQMEVPASTGQMPARVDLHDQLESKAHNGISAQLEMFETTDETFVAHENALFMYYTGTISHFQNALRGEISPEEACNRAAADTRDQIGL